MGSGASKDLPVYQIGLWQLRKLSIFGTIVQGLDNEPITRRN
jgi:hypothetical protein